MAVRLAHMRNGQAAKVTVFYSWQSDSPSRTNRNFIEDALDRAVREIKKEGVLSVVPVIDRDTKDTPGAPNIGETILQKIDNSQIFLCDVTTINTFREETGRPTPNPNVLVELGYALKALGQNRLIMVFNKAFGRVEDRLFAISGASRQGR
jgi:predicted nucleotide-binding protein